MVRPKARRLDIGVYGARGIPSTYSGYETFLTALLPELAGRGHRVTMYCRSGEVPRGDDYRGVRRRWLPAVKTKQASTLTHGALAALACRARRHDVVLAVNVANAPFCALSRWTGQPVALNLDGQEWLRGKWGTFGRRFFLTCAKLTRYTVTAPVSDCAAMADLYLRDFGTPSTVIPYFHEGVAAADRPDQVRTLGVEPYQYFVIAGRFVPENNIHRVAELYSAMSSDLPLVVLGSANYDSPVTRQLTDLAARDRKIKILGHLPDRRDFGTLLAYARRYIHAHSVGGTNPSLVEALGVGAHITTLDTPFNREVAGSAADYFDDFDDTLRGVLSSAVDQAAVDNAKRDRARVRAAGRYSLTDIADAYEDLLSEISARRPSRLAAVPTKWTHSDA